MKPNTMVVSVVVVVAAVAVLGRESWSYLSAGLDVTRAEVKERIPLNVEIARLRALLSRLDREIYRRRGSLVEMEIRAEELQNELNVRERKLADDESVLRMARNLLKDRRSAYRIGGIEYSWAEVDRDAAIKAERFRQDKELLAEREDTLGEISVAMAQIRQLLSEAEVERMLLGNEVDKLETAAVRIQAQRNVDASVNPVTGRSAGRSYEDIRRGIEELSRRMARSERLLEIDRTALEGIPYAENASKSGLEVLEEVIKCEPSPKM
jgi:hypothetical protein